MRCMFDFLNGPYVAANGNYDDPIIINSGTMIHNRIKYVHVEFHRDNNFFCSRRGLVCSVSAY